MHFITQEEEEPRQAAAGSRPIHDTMIDHEKNVAINARAVETSE
jgi:hypothetical protein